PLLPQWEKGAGIGVTQSGFAMTSAHPPVVIPAETKRRAGTSSQRLVNRRQSPPAPAALFYLSSPNGLEAVSGTRRPLHPCPGSALRLRRSWAGMTGNGSERSERL